MASGTSAAPSLFLRNATGLVKGWSGFDAFSYSFMSVNLVTLGMFYSLAVFAYVPGANPILSIVLAAVAVTFLAVAYAGLIAAMPRAGGDYIWQSRILDGIPGILTGAVVGAVGFYLVSQAAGLDSTLAIGAGVVGVDRRRVDRPAQRWDRLRPGGHRLVVHPRDVGADLRRDPQHRVLPAARRAGQVRRRPVVLRLAERHPVRLDRDDHPDVRARRARHGRLRPDPEVVPVSRADRPRDHVRADAHLEPGRLQGRLRPREPEHVRHQPARTTRRLPTRRSTTPGSRPSPPRTWAATCPTRCSRPWP